MKLVIAEKQRFAQKMAAVIGAVTKKQGYYEGGGYYVAWCSGHLFSDVKPEKYTGKKWSDFGTLPILPKKWIREPVENKLNLIRTIKDLSKRSGLEAIIHAGDPDREGQRIVDEVIEHVGWRGEVIRFRCGSPNPDAIRKAMGKLRSNLDPMNKNASLAAKARSESDYRIGFNMSPAYSIALNMKGAAVGRIKIPAGALVVNRDREIDGFISKNYFDISVSVNHQQNSPFKASFQYVRDADYLDQFGKITDSSLASKIISETGKNGVIIEYKETNGSEQPPKGYSLSKMQSEAGKRFRLKPDEVLMVCQKLYEMEIATYPRSSKTEFEMDSHSDAPKVMNYISKVFPDLSSLINKCDTKIISPAWTKKEYEHYALAPLASNRRIDSLSDSEKGVFKLICERYIMQFLGQSKHTSIVTVVQGGCKHKYKATSKKITNKGWKALSNENTPKDIPLMNEGDKVSLECLKEAKKTSAPPRFTETSLCEALAQIHTFVKDPQIKARLRDTSGLGTEATRSSIIKQMVDRGALQEKKKGKSLYIVSSPSLRTLIDALPDSIKDPGMTALWEDALEGIAEDKMSYEKFTKLQESNIIAMIEEAKSLADANGNLPKAGPPCPICKKVTESRKGQYGDFFACTDYPKCKGILNAEGIAPPKKIEGPDCPKCGSVTYERGKGDKKFFGCSKFPKCKGIVGGKEIEHGPDCDKCGKKTIKREGKNGPFYGCSGFPKCKNIMNSKDDSQECSVCGSKLRKTASGLRCRMCKTTIR